jgi:hypothetical protein
LSVSVSGFVSDWCVRSDAGVASLTVVEELKVSEDRVGEFYSITPGRLSGQSKRTRTLTSVECRDFGLDLCPTLDEIRSG